jgi:hypothetical protein
MIVPLKPPARLGPWQRRNIMALPLQVAYCVTPSIEAGSRWNENRLENRARRIDDRLTYKARPHEVETSDNGCGSLSLAPAPRKRHVGDRSQTPTGEVGIASVGPDSRSSLPVTQIGIDADRRPSQPQRDEEEDIIDSRDVAALPNVFPGT